MTNDQTLVLFSDRFGKCFLSSSKTSSLDGSLVKSKISSICVGWSQAVTSSLLALEVSVCS